MSAEVGLTEAEGVRRALEDWMIDNRWAYEAYDFSHALVASDWLARIKAEAWERGRQTGLDDCATVPWGQTYRVTDNPYSIARSADASGDAQ